MNTGQQQSVRDRADWGGTAREHATAVTPAMLMRYKVIKLAAQRASTVSRKPLIHGLKLFRAELPSPCSTILHLSVFKHVPLPIKITQFQNQC
jgi:hypothetical protein